MTNAEELDTFTAEIKEANWHPMKKTFKLITTTTLAAGLMFAGYWAGEAVTNHKYAYTEYMSANAIGVARDQLALCRGENKHCTTKQLQEAVNRLSGEAWVQGEGKP
jgi:hypothetical protein